MAIITCNYKSVTLNYSTDLYIILPITPDVEGQMGKPLEEIYKKRSKYKTLLLLHGANDDPSCYIRNTGIERYATEKGIAVILPYARNSFYTDMKHGQKYNTFIAKEVPQFARSILPLSEKREDNYIAGLSMGGYGALKIALEHPDQYEAAASMSGVLDIQAEVEQMKAANINLSDIFGDLDKLENSQHDVLQLLKQVKESGETIPRIYQACGTEDFLYESNQTFRRLAESLNLQEYRYEEGKGGHDWEFWDKYLKRIVEWV